jgi:hypothetical protein
LVFIRYEHPNYKTKLEDIELFNYYVDKINPNCNYKILLFKAEKSVETLSCDKLIEFEPEDKKKLYEHLSKLKKET